MAKTTKKAKPPAKPAVKAAPASSNLKDAAKMFSQLLAQPNANASQIGKLSGINPVAINELKHGRMTSITDAMFGKLKKLHADVLAGKISFEATHRGRKAGSKVKSASPTVKKPVVPAKAKKAGRPSKVTAASAPVALPGITDSVSSEMIAEKEALLKKLSMEVEYLKELRKIQEKFKGMF